MPYWSVLYLALGGLLLGAAWSMRTQKAPLWAIVIVLVLAGTCATLSAAGFDRVGESVGLAALVAGLATAWWRG